MLPALPTRAKISLAHLLYRIVRLFHRHDQVQVTRSGIHYRLDLSEAIDLSIFLTGSFQSHVAGNSFLELQGPICILDIGANVGSMSLAFAKRYPQAQIISFEPTDYALAKFRVNLGLNPLLAERVEVIQAFLSDAATPHHELKAYASWKVGGAKDGAARHPIHCGGLKTIAGVPVTTLDEFCAGRKLAPIGLIKIDTDGHEHKVLEGARQVIAKHRPHVIFEVGQYVMEEGGITFEWYLEYFDRLGYRLSNISDKRAITRDNWKRQIPKFGTIDVLSTPERQRPL